MPKSRSKPFCISTFLRDTDTLKHDELGIYIRLLEYMWVNDLMLPNNDKKLAHILKIATKKWQHYKKTLQNFFIFSRENITHLELKKEYQKTVRISKQNSLNIAKRWASSRNTTTIKELKQKPSDVQLSDFIYDTTVSNTHIRSYIRPYIRSYCLDAGALHARASSKDLDIRFDDIDGHVDNSHKAIKLAKPEIAQSEITAFLAKIQLLFSKAGMILPKDTSLILEWLESGKDKDFIYHKIQQVLMRIDKRKLESPRSFAYFAKEIVGTKYRT